jgi:hypothetical protein
MIPLIQATTDETTSAFYKSDMDVISSEADSTPSAFSQRILEMIGEVASRRYTPKLYGTGNTDFQFTRGLLGVSM